MRSMSLSALSVLCLISVIGFVQPVNAQHPDSIQANTPDAAPGIRFSFSEATFQQVIDFFSRASGLPVILETAPPEGTLTYLSPESYSRAEALQVLNVILQSRGVMLRSSDDMLYLQQLTELQREDIPTYIGQLPDEITSDQLVTVVRPLSVALAKPLAERLATMVAAYGAVTAMEQQNALIITETAAQIRRLFTIIDELDREDPEGLIEIIPIRHADAQELMEPLKALLAQRVEKFVINQKGEQVKIEEDRMPGLNFTVDARTNSLVAKGSRPMIDKLREAIDLLDVPALDRARGVRTFALNRLSAAQAAQQLGALFQTMPKDKRPKVIRQDDVNCVTVIGSDEAVSDAGALLRQLDGLGMADEAADLSTTMAVLPLEHAQPQAVVQALQGLLTTRQRAILRLAPAPNGRGLIVSGPVKDVATLRGILPALDSADQVQRQVRILRLTAPQPAAMLTRVTELYEAQIDPDDEATRVAATLDDERTLTLIGRTPAIEQFIATMRQVESSIVIDRETRQVMLTHAMPSALVSSMSSLARQLLQPRDGQAYIEPQFEPVDDLDLLIIAALPQQFAVIDSLVQELDKPDPRDVQFRVMSMTGVDRADLLLQRTDEAYARLTAGYEPDELPRPDATLDPMTGNLVLIGRTDAVSMYERAMQEARNLLPPAREGRLLALRQARAEDVLPQLQQLLQTATTQAGTRQVPKPEIRIVEPTNSLYVIAEPAQQQVIAQFVQQLDTFELAELPPMRLLQVRAADVNELGRMLQQRFDNRPAELRRTQPVSITADTATSTLIVTAHEDVFEDIREFVQSINLAGETAPQRETIILPLQVARATDVAQALEKLYPEPPMPRDRRGNPLPHLQQPREVLVSADGATNTLIIEAPSERRASFEALVDKLDRVELPPRAELRTYQIERGDLQQISRTLNDLARQGVLSDQPVDGSKSVEVLIQVEPISRTLIVAGDQTTFEQTENILRDLQAVPVPRSLRVFDVIGADPNQIAEQAMTLYRQQTQDDPVQRPVSVEIDAAHGSLLVVAEDEAMIRFAGILNQLQDAIGPPPDVRLHTVEHADATDVATYLDDLIASSKSMLGKRMGSAPSIEVIERTNSLLIGAQPEQHQIIDALIAELDRAEPREVPPLRILQLRSADAANLANALNRQYGERPIDERNDKPVRIVADPQTNALMVAAHPDVLPEIQSIVQELNIARRSDTEGREIRIFPLKVARASELAQTLDEMFPEPPIPLDYRGRPQPQLREPREVVVRADPQTNSILVDAPVQRMPGFEQLVEQLDRARLTDQTEIRTYRITHVDLQSAANTLQQLAQAGTLNPSGQDRRVPITITTEPSSDRLVVSGPIEIFERVESVLDEIDASRNGPTTTLRFFTLEYARADSVANMLRGILLTRIAEDVPDAGADAEALLNVTADNKTNTLIISAPQSIMPVAEQIIEQLDRSTAGVGDPIVRVRPLTFADAREITTSLTTALPQVISPATGEPVDVKLIAAPGSNAVILVGLAADLESIEGMIEPLDARPAMDAIDARTFRLVHAEAAQIASIVQNLLTDQLANDPRFVIEQMRRSRGNFQVTPKIRVEADARTNSLIVSGPQRTVALAESLITELDREDEDGQRIYRTYTAQSADPAALVAVAQQVIEATRPQGRRSTLRLVSEPQSGAILLMGPEDEVESAMMILASRDDATPQPPQLDLKLVHLAHSDAVMLAPTLQSLLRDRTRWPAGLQRYARAGLPVVAPTVTAEAATNRLYITAPKEVMPLAASLIGELDRADAAGSVTEVRIYTLKQADADTVARAVERAMNTQAQQVPGRPTITVTAEPSSNTLIVTATPNQFQQVDALIKPMDSGVAADQAQVRTVFLRHARAERVAPIVQQLLQGEDIPIWMRMDAARRRQPLPDTGPDVRVAADPRLNAVVIAAPSSVLSIAEQMVVQLDVDPELAASSSRSVRVLLVNNADVSAIAQTIEAMFSMEDALDTPPTVRTDPTSNTLIVRATEAQFLEIARVVQEIDIATISTARQMQMIPIDPSRASAEDVAATIQRLLEQGNAGSVEVISIEDLMQQFELDDASSSASDPPADATSMRLPAIQHALLATAVGMIDLAKLKALNEDDTSVTDEEPFDADAPLPFPAEMPADDVVDDAPASDAEPVHVIAAPAVEPGALDDPDGAQITIAVDPATNSIVVLGSPRSIERVTALAQQIQQQMPVLPATIKYITLPEQVDAQATARLIQQTLGQITPPGGTRGALRQRAAVIADPVGNALIVACNDVDFKTVGRLIAALSQGPAADQVLVKVYPLATVTAHRAAQNVQQLVAPAVDQPRGRNRQAQRVRDMAMKLVAGDAAIEAVFDPSRIRVTADEQTNCLYVSAPAEAIVFIDQLVELIDQTPVQTQSTLKLYPIRYARAQDLQQTLRQIFRARHRSLQRTREVATLEPDFAADARTNTLLVTAAPEQLAEVDQLLKELDQELGEDMHPLRIIELQAALPTNVARVIDQVVIGSDQDRRTATVVLPDDASGTLLVRASPAVNDEIDSVLAEIDRDAAAQFPVRTITLERANADAVAQAIQRFYDDRARIASQGRGRRAQQRRVSVVGDQMSSTLLIAASDEDFAQIEQLVAQFDSPQANDALELRVFPLEFARASEIEDTVRQLIEELTWGQGPFFFWDGRSNNDGQGTLAISSNDRLNAIIATGEGDKFTIVEDIIAVLDSAPAEGEERLVRLYRVRSADLDVVAGIVEELFTDTTRANRWWEPANPYDVKVRRDARSNTLIVSATANEHDEVATLIESIEAQVQAPDQDFEVLAVQFADARELARTLQDFLRTRADATNAPPPTATIIPSASANSLVVSAEPDTAAFIRDLLEQLDKPDVSGDRSIELIAVTEGEAADIMRIVEQHFGKRGGTGVIVTADPRANSLIVNAPRAQLAQVKALIAQLDAPRAADETVIRTYTLDGAQADNAVAILSQTLQLDARGEARGITIKLDEDSDAVEINARIVADPRSNSIIVTATTESLPVIESLIQQLDDVPAASPVEYRIITLEHAPAEDVSFSLRDIMRQQSGRRTSNDPAPRIDYNRRENQLIIAATPDQYEQLLQIIEQMDQPSQRQRRTDFVPLEFAEAELVQEALSVFYGPYAIEADTPGKRNARIVADPATNSLVISADENEWASITALLAELDSEQYDSSLQLKVLPLRYADARSVARAINEAFEGQIERGRRNDDSQRNRGNDERPPRRQRPVRARRVGGVGPRLRRGADQLGDRLRLAAEHPQDRADHRTTRRARERQTARPAHHSGAAGRSRIPRRRAHRTLRAAGRRPGPRRHPHHRRPVVQHHHRPRRGGGLRTDRRTRRRHAAADGHQGSFGARDQPRIRVRGAHRQCDPRCLRREGRADQPAVLAGGGHHRQQPCHRVQRADHRRDPRNGEGTRPPRASGGAGHFHHRTAAHRAG
jgi:type II secretory pathway component GspD/PulD (secretin)